MVQILVKMDARWAMSSQTNECLNWSWRRFDELSNAQFYDILALRQRVFILEQKCLYLDADGRDKEALHLFGCVCETSLKENCSKEILAYARLLPPNTRYVEPSIGRVLVTESARGKGLGQRLIWLCLEKCEALYPDKCVRVSAQVYLKRFYRSFGFEVVGNVYDDDGIPHVDMVRCVSLSRL